MENNNILIHQAYYGEVDRAHSCIKQTVEDKELKSFLIGFTDRPAALPPNIELEPYLSGCVFSKYYIFSKTFPDKTASRSGMVFSHVLVIEINDIYSILNIYDILDKLCFEIPSNRELLNEFELKNLSLATELNEFLPKYIQQAISNLIKGKNPILFSGDVNYFKKILQHLWSSSLKDFKRKIKFRTSFTPSDISNTKDLTIVSIQHEFLSKWKNKPIILVDEEQIEIIDETEKLFLGIKNNDLFVDFVTGLNVNLNELSILNKCEELYNTYINIEIVDNVDFFRTQLRQLSQISPNSIDGSNIKNKFLDKIDYSYSSKKDTNLKALRNIDWSAFEKGESRVKRILTDFITSEFNVSKECKIETLSELLILSIIDIDKTWWHKLIFDEFKNLLLNYNQTVFLNFWLIIDFSKENFKNIFELFDSKTDYETYLRNSIPSVLKDTTIDEAIEISLKRKWYLLNAELLLKRLKPELAILKQVKVEIDLTIENSLGVKYIAEKISDTEIINLTINQNDKKLIYISFRRIIKNKMLLENINVKNPIWLEIWELVLSNKLDLSYGIEQFESKIIMSVYDLVKEKNVIPNIIIDLISKSKYADLSNYNYRKELWDELPTEFLSRFIKITSRQIAENLVLDLIEIKSIEQIVINEIVSDSFISTFLNKHKSEIAKIIKIYNFFPILKDQFLADYINYYTNSISEIDAINLGNLILRERFSLSAKSIYDKSKSKASFRVAFEICKDLVRMDFIEKIFGSHKKQKNTEFYIQANKEIIMDKKLPLIVILTAIKEEYSAVRNHLKNINDYDNNGTGYEKGIFILNDITIADVIIRECGAKNNIAAQEVERAINNFMPNMMLFVGIAGSRKPNDFKIGDVIFPEKIYSYEGGKATKESFKARPEAESPTFTLLETAKKERLKDDWKQLIKGSYEIQPNADIGNIASGEQLIDHQSTEVGMILKEHYNDTSAVEMEGYGFIKATKRQGMKSSNIIFGVVRSISDVIEEDQNQQNLKNDRRPENAKIFASDTASAFAFWLINKTYN